MQFGNMTIVGQESGLTYVLCHCKHRFIVSGLIDADPTKLVQPPLNEVIINGDNVKCPACDCTWQIKSVDLSGKKVLPDRLRKTTVPLKHFIAYIIYDGSPIESPVFLAQSSDMVSFLAQHANKIVEAVSGIKSLRVSEVSEEEATKMYYDSKDAIAPLVDAILELFTGR